ncbi:MAG: DUF2391 family protein [Candidatus Woesearchaeota archaeon]
MKKKPNKNKKTTNLETINKKLDYIIRTQKKILYEEKTLEKEEKDVFNIEKNISKKEESEIESLEKNFKLTEKEQEKSLLELKNIEEEIKKEFGEHPLKKIGWRDIVKGAVGAFIGLVVHYTFFYGIKISENLDLTRASLLFVLSFFIGILFIYTTGFRKVKDPKILMFIPLRLIILYIIAVLMSIIVLFLFYPKFGHDFNESYKMVSVVLLAAIIGACTADLIGKE